MTTVSVDAKKVGYEVRDRVAVLAIDNPPVNATSHAVRSQLFEHLQAALEDEIVLQILVICRGNTFVAGADISEFGKPPVHPALSWLIDRIEASGKPVIAAVHGTALGGGLELALGCHYRIAQRDAKFGLPEVKLGLLPGAGGTQRLPRVVGIRRALDMIVQGDPIGAAQALEFGLVDRIADGDLQASALAYAADLRAAGSGVRPVRERTDRLEPLVRDFFSTYRYELQKRTGRSIAPGHCVQAVEAAATMPFDAGRAREKELFQELVGGQQSKALRYVFFAEREAAKLPAPAQGKPGKVRQVGLLGSPQEGKRQLELLARAGVTVDILDPAGSTARVQGPYDMVIDASALAPSMKAAWLSQHRAQLGSVPILATARSHLEAMADAGLGERAFASEWQQDGKLVEIAWSVRASDSHLATTLAFARQLQRIPLVARAQDTGVGERLLGTWDAELRRALWSGRFPQALRDAIADFGPRARMAMQDPADVRQVSDGHGDDASPWLERMVYAMVREGIGLLQSGTVLRASDIDIACIQLLGWPSYLGGPMFQANLDGMAAVQAKLAAFAAAAGEASYEPPSLLKDLLEKSADFNAVRADRILATP